MGDSFLVIAGDQGGHGDHILWIIVFDRFQITKLSVSCFFIPNQVSRLNIHTFAVGFCADKINLTHLLLSYMHGIAQADQVLVDHILDDLLYISFPVPSRNRVAYAVVFEVILVISIFGFDPDTLVCK